MPTDDGPCGLGARRRPALLLVVTLVLGVGGPRAPAVAQSPTADRDGWTLELGPYLGYYDFDALTYFDDRGLFGARVGVHLGPWARGEAEFDEVYTRRSSSGSRARQISLALHVRGEPARWRLAPSLLAGLAFVGLDDSEDADAFSEAWDAGAGLRYAVSARWVVRVDGVLRRQRMRIFRLGEDGEPVPLAEEEQVLWGRSLRAAVAYVF